MNNIMNEVKDKSEVKMGTLTEKLTPQRKLFIETAIKMFGDGAIISRVQVDEARKASNLSWPYWFIKTENRVSSGMYKLFSLEGKLKANTSMPIPVPTPFPVPLPPIPAPSPAPIGITEETVINLFAINSDKENLVPSKFEGFVNWGHYNTIGKIVKSGLFYPVFITGLSGNGKTLMVEQIHADLKKELIRVNITIETDEDDLLGGFRLVNGETKFIPGPVIEAMERGCTLLLDECDLGSNKLLALQPVLEGKGIYLKKVNKWITAKTGFNVIATANTKGKGSEDGRFIGTNILNEAFLERFAITLEQPYAGAGVEKKIILGSMEKYGKVDDVFADNLIKWAGVIRQTFYSGGIDEVISTRRLDHIVKAFAIFEEKMTAIEMCVARFDEDTKISFIDLYTKIDAGIDVSGEAKESLTELSETVAEQSTTDTSNRLVPNVSNAMHGMSVTVARHEEYLDEEEE